MEEHGIPAPHWVPQLQVPVLGRGSPQYMAIKNSGYLTVRVAHKAALNPDVLLKDPYTNSLTVTHLGSGKRTVTWEASKTYRERLSYVFRARTGGTVAIFPV